MSLGAAADTPLSRRLLLVSAGLATGLAASGGLSASAQPAAAALPGPSDPEKCLENYIKLTSDLSGRPVYGWQKGMIYGLMPGQKSRPLLGIEGFGCGSIEKQGDGSYHSLWKELLFYTDLRTGEIVDTWVNPYNKVSCDILQVHNRSVNMVMKPHFPDYAAMGLDFGYPSVASADDAGHPYYLDSAVVGDQVTLFSDFRSYRRNPMDPKIWRRESTGEFVSISEYYANCGSLAALLDPTVKNVPSDGHWNRICPWLPWMLMGGQPGELFYRSVTRKLNTPGELPPKLRRYAEKNYPEFLIPPTDFNIPGESSWNVFMRERKPAPAL